MVNIEVAAATQQMQKIISLFVPQGTTIQQAVIASGICADFPEIPDWEQFDSLGFKLAIYSKVVSGNALVEAGDRIEIVWPLRQSAMDARRARAKGKA